MSDFTHRVVSTFSDLTVGTLIVLVHAALANRQSDRAKQAEPVRANQVSWRGAPDGTRA